MPNLKFLLWTDPTNQPKTKPSKIRSLNQTKTGQKENFVVELSSKHITLHPDDDYFFKEVSDHKGESKFPTYPSQ